MKSIKLFTNIILLILIAITFVLKILTNAKIIIGILLIIFILLINIKILSLEIYRKLLIISLIIIIPLMYKSSFTAYNIYQNPILFEKEYNDVKCLFNNLESTFYIKGNGKTPSYESIASVEWKQYKKGIMNVIIDDEITTIGSNLFSNCKALVNVNLSENITIIGNYSFSECSKLSNFNSEEKYTIKIPENTNIIGKSAFYNCIRIKKIYLSKNISEIHDNAFYCPNLLEVYFDGTKEEWDKIKFGNNVFPSNVKIYYNIEL